MKAQASAALLGCLILGCSQNPAKSSHDETVSPRTGAYQSAEDRMEPASRVIVVERVEQVEPSQRPDDPLAEPMVQGDSVEDQRTTQRIRQALQQDDSLSFAAKNVKVITLNERVTLRGPVESMTESQRVEAHAKQVAGPENVTNQLEINQQRE